MTNQDLYRAIGEADETFLLECETQPARHISRRFVIIAAVVALMLTACAAPVIARNFSALKKGNIVPSTFDYEIPVEIRGDGTVLKTEAVYTSGSMALQIVRSHDAPDTLEEYYIPAELTDLCTIESCMVAETCLTMAFTRQGRQGRTIYDILYRQYVIPENGELSVDCFLDRGSFTQTEKTTGNITFIELSGICSFGKVIGYSDGRKLRNLDEPGPSYTARFLFWSDGRYVYCVKMPMFPPHNGNQAVEDVINSLTAVEDISQYLTAE